MVAVVSRIKSNNGGQKGIWRRGWRGLKFVGERERKLGGKTRQSER